MRNGAPIHDFWGVENRFIVNFSLDFAQIFGREKLHSIWFQAIALALVPAVIVGFGRFAYGLVLPAMRLDLGLSYAQLGALNTANALGYFVGALCCAPVARRFPERSLIFWGVLASVVILLATGLARSYAALLVLRALVGFSAAFPNIVATGLAAKLGAQNAKISATVLGMAIAGPGLGVAFTGATLPFLLAGESDKWPLAWEFLAFVGLAAFAVILWGTRDLKAPKTDDSAPQNANGAAPKLDFRPLIPAFFAYFLFGLGYIAYMTFFVAYISSLGASPATVALAFTTLGAAMFGASFAWRGRLSRERGGFSLFLMGILAGIAAILPLFSSSLWVLMISAIGFGLTTMAVYTGVTVLLRLHWPRESWTLGVAYATTIFALGQSIGPYGSGFASDIFGPVASLVWSSAILTLAGLVALFQRPKAV